MRTLLILLLLTCLPLLPCFIQCPAGGVRTCNASTAPYQLINAGSVLISDCLYIGCPQIVISASNVTVRNVTFEGGGALTRNLSYSDGGAVFYLFSDTFTPTILSVSDSTFRNYRNSNLNAGGVMYLSIASMDSVNIRTSRFINNTVSGNGGSIYAKLNSEGTLLTLQTCYFEGNSGGGDGGSIWVQGANVLVQNCTAIGNSAGGGGGFLFKSLGNSTVIKGGIFQSNVAGTFGGVACISQESFFFFLYSIGNSASNRAVGNGGTFSFESTNYVLIDGLTVTNGRADNGEGGVLYAWATPNLVIRNLKASFCYAGLNGGVIKSYLTGYLSLESSVMTNNSASIGGGGSLALENRLFPSSIVEISNCQFTNNSAPAPLGLGGTIFTRFNSLALTNCTFTSNWAHYQGGVISFFGSDTSLQVNASTFLNNYCEGFGGILNLEGRVSIQMFNVVVVGASGTSAGCFFLTGPLATRAVFSNLTAIDIYSQQSGGVFYSYIDAPIWCDNCRFQNMASQIGAVIYGSSLSNNSLPSLITNSAFIGAVAQSGGIMYLQESFSLIVRNTLISNCKSSMSGGVAFLLNRGKVVFDQVVVSNVYTDTTGGLSYSKGQSEITLNNCTLREIYSSSFGSLIYDSAGIINLVRVDYSNGRPASNTLFHLELSKFYMDKLVLVPTGPSIFDMSLSCEVTVDQLIVVNLTATNTDGSLISAKYASTLTLGPGSIVTGFANGTFLFKIQSGSRLRLLANVSLSGNAPSDYLIHVSEQSFLEINSSQILGCPGCSPLAFSPIFIDSGSAFICSNSKLNGHLFSGSGAVFVSSSSSFSSINCQIQDNAYSAGASICDAGRKRSSTLISSNSLKGFGGAICSFGSVTLNNGTLIAGNYALYGGAIYVGPDVLQNSSSSNSGASNFVAVNAGARIRNNVAALNGGAFYLTGSSIQIESRGVEVSNNSVLFGGSNASTLAFYASSFSDGYLSLNPSSSSSSFSSILEGGIYVDYPSVAALVLKNPNLKPAGSSIVWSGRASYLSILNVNDFSDSAIELNRDFIPPIRIGAYDYFDNPAVYKQGSSSSSSGSGSGSGSGSSDLIVTVRVAETLHNSILAGDVVRSILSADSNVLIFDNLQLPQKLPGPYELSFSPMDGTIMPLPSDLSYNSSTINSLRLPVTFRDCDDGFLFSTPLHTCFPTVRISPSLRTLFASLALIVLCYGGVSIWRINFHRTHFTIASTVSNFTLLQVKLFGTVVSMLSLVLQIFSSSPMIQCTLSVWLESLGFIATVWSISQSSLEILSKRFNKASLSHTNLTLPLNLLLMIAFLLGWTASDPFTTIPVFYPVQKYYLVDRCQSRSEVYFVLLQALKLAGSVGAFSISFYLDRLITASDVGKQERVGITMISPEKAPQKSLLPLVQEHDLLSLCSYNWLVFGPLISLIADRSISDPNTGYFFSKIAVIVPNVLTLVILASSRIYICHIEDERQKGNSKVKE